jgi:hypothetical protein
MDSMIMQVVNHIADRCIEASGKGRIKLPCIIDTCDKVARHHDESISDKVNHEDFRSYR